MLKNSSPHLSQDLLRHYRMQVEVARLSRKLETEHRLTLSECVALDIILLSPGIQPLKLANAISMTPGSTTPLIESLRRGRFIWIQTSRNDRRAKHIYATRKAFEKIHSVKQSFSHYPDLLR